MWVKSILLAAITVAGAHAAPVDANPRAQLFQPNHIMPVQQRRGDNQQDIRPLREVVDEMRSRYGGELISARLEDGGRPIYVIRWRMPDGEVRDFRVNAAR